MFCGVPYLIGYLMLSYAHYSSTAIVFNVVLFGGRALAGFGMGWASAVSPVYTGELCSAKLRGVFVNFFPVFLTTGVLFNFALGAIDNFRYYDTSLVAVGIVALFEVLMFWLPETPRWLMSQGYAERAEHVLLWLRGNKIGIGKELADMKKSLSQKKTNVWKLFLQRRVFQPLVYLLILFFVQQMGGINGITPFAGLILSDAGLSNPRTTSIYAVGLSGFVGLSVSIVLVDLIGRKTPLIISEIGQFLAIIMLGIHAYITRPSLCDFSTSDAMPCNPQFQYMALVSIIGFALSFTAGANSVPYVLLAEFMPLSVRGKASGIVAALTWGSSALFTGLYFEFREWITPWFTLWLVALVDLIGVVFIILIIPETKGKKLEELEKVFVKRPDTVETVL
jgi:SP family facilitated glucose transporter-like MFS transporter 8